jgi:hypothetical protein
MVPWRGAEAEDQDRDSDSSRYGDSLRVRLSTLRGPGRRRVELPRW